MRLTVIHGEDVRFHRQPPGSRGAGSRLERERPHVASRAESAARLGSRILPGGRGASRAGGRSTIAKRSTSPRRARTCAATCSSVTCGTRASARFAPRTLIRFATARGSGRRRARIGGFERLRARLDSKRNPSSCAATCAVKRTASSSSISSCRSCTTPGISSTRTRASRPSPRRCARPLLSSIASRPKRASRRTPAISSSPTASEWSRSTATAPWPSACSRGATTWRACSARTRARKARIPSIDSTHLTLIVFGESTVPARFPEDRRARSRVAHARRRSRGRTVVRRSLGDRFGERRSFVCSVLACSCGVQGPAFDSVATLPDAGRHPPGVGVDPAGELPERTPTRTDDHGCRRARRPDGSGRRFVPSCARIFTPSSRSRRASSKRCSRRAPS